MSKKLTILIEDSVYECLHRVVGRGTMAMQSYTAIVEKEGDVYVALCPELDVASQGASIEQATANLKEAVEFFFECADPQEIARRQHSESM